MKNLIKWSEKFLKRMTVWDWALLAKPALILMGIIIGAYISTFVKANIWCFVTVFVVLYVILLYRIFWNKK